MQAPVAADQNYLFHFLDVVHLLVNVYTSAGWVTFDLDQSAATNMHLN